MAYAASSHRSHSHSPMAGWIGRHTLILFVLAISAMATLMRLAMAD